MKRYLLSVDQGTTSSRAILFDKEGQICSVAQKEYKQIYPKASWVEHDPMDIWSSQISVITEAMSKIGAKAKDIVAIGITNQRETTIVWDKKTGKPIYNAIVWQCRRTSDRIDKLVAEGMKDVVIKKTGLIPDAYFSATKIAWILDHVEGARERANKGELLFGTVDTWLMWQLSNGKIHKTDYTNASRTMLYNIHSLEWDKELLDYFNIPMDMMPTVHPSSYVYGYAEANLLGGDIPIAGVAGDQQSALFGQCCFDAGDVKNTYGTGCFLLMNTGSKAVESNNGLLTTIAASREGEIKYALEGSVFVAGAAIQWLRDELGIIKNDAESEKLARQVEDTAGVYVVPAFTGLGAPYWNQEARGIITGITRGTNKSHIVRATLESLAYQVYELIEVMKKDGDMEVANLKVDGGASANNFLMQFQSDILDANVYRPECIETTALGAAYLAGLGVGFIKDEQEIIKNNRITDVFKPTITSGVREELLEGWKKAVAKVL